MGMFDHFPYTNFHELNLDWILQALKEIEKTMDQFVAINSLKYADPIQWSIIRQYEKNTIVIDPLTGTAYISVQAVPSGVALTNTDYWTVVFDLRSFVVRAAKNFTLRWEEATTLTATMPINQGQWVVWGDTLYRALSNIIAGDQYVIDSNIKRITVEEIKEEIYQTFNNIIGSLDDLTTTDKSNLVAAINEIVRNIGSLDDLTTTDKSNIVAAINEIVSGLATEVEARTNADNSINEKINNMRVYNVRDYGAIGDGEANDTDAIKATFTAAVDGVVYIPDGTYLISDTIIVTRGLYMSNGATLKANANVDILRLKPNKCICGGRIDVSFDGFDHSAILLLGADKFDDVNDIKKTYIKDIYIDGQYTGMGIFFHADLQSDTTSFIQNITVENCTISRLRYGIRLLSDTAPDNAHATWVNGNTFSCIWLQGCVYCINVTGAQIPYEAAGNSFDNIMVQTYHYYTRNVVLCSSNLNRFNIFIWDYILDVPITDYPAVTINGSNNYIWCNLSPFTRGHYLDRGSGNTIITPFGLEIIPPTSGINGKFAGDQDDYLFRADRRFAVYTTPTIATIANAFNRNGGEVAILEAGTSYEIRIEMTNAQRIIMPQLVYLAFETSALKSVGVELYIDGAYTTIYSELNTKRKEISIPLNSGVNVERIRISIDAIEEQHLIRIAAQDAYRHGVPFVENYGATYSGRLAFTDDSNDGIVLLDANDGHYYLVGCSNGQLTTTRL